MKKVCRILQIQFSAIKKLRTFSAKPEGNKSRKERLEREERPSLATTLIRKIFGLRKSKEEVRGLEGGRIGRGEGKGCLENERILFVTRHTG